MDPEKALNFCRARGSAPSGGCGMVERVNRHWGGAPASSHSLLDRLNGSVAATEREQCEQSESRLGD